VNLVQVCHGAFFLVLLAANVAQNRLGLCATC
jgi:hypothetical protein